MAPRRIPGEAIGFSEEKIARMIATAVPAPVRAPMIDAINTSFRRIRSDPSKLPFVVKTRSDWK
jgi:hypothetical protein